MIDFDNSYIGKNLNQLSQLGNTLTDGDMDVSISGRIGFNCKYHPNKFWNTVRSIVDFTFYPIEGPGHCDTAYKRDLNETYTPGGVFFLLVILVIIVVTFCIPLSVIFWGYKGLKELIISIKQIYFKRILN